MAKYKSLQVDFVTKNVGEITRRLCQKLLLYQLQLLNTSIKNGSYSVLSLHDPPKMTLQVKCVWPSCVTRSWITVLFWDHLAYTTVTSVVGPT